MKIITGNVNKNKPILFLSIFSFFSIWCFSFNIVFFCCWFFLLCFVSFCFCLYSVKKIANSIKSISNLSCDHVYSRISLFQSYTGLMECRSVLMVEIARGSREHPQVLIPPCRVQLHFMVSWLNFKNQTAV